MAKTLLERFNDKYIPEPNSGCWLWTASCHEDTGYGQVNRGRRGEGMELAHVAAYRLFVGQVPAGKELDHLCRVRCCVNPQHLEPVTHSENILRGAAPRALRARHAAVTHCRKGHAKAGANLIVKRRQGYQVRVCRECTRAWNKLRYLPKGPHAQSRGS